MPETKDDLDADQDDLALGAMIADSVQSLAAHGSEESTAVSPKNAGGDDGEDELDLHAAISEAMQSVQAELGNTGHTEHTEKAESAARRPETEVEGEQEGALREEDDTLAALEHVLADALMAEQADKDAGASGSDVYEPEGGSLQNDGGDEGGAPSDRHDELDAALTSAIGDALRTAGRYDDTDDLVRAIGTAIDENRDAKTDESRAEHGEKHGGSVSDDHLNAVIAASLQLALKNDHEDMDVAIADAFKSALRDDTASEDHGLAQMVQNLVTRAGEGEVLRETLRELALEISLQVKGHQEGAEHAESEGTASEAAVDPQLAELSRDQGPGEQAGEQAPAARGSDLVSRLLPSSALFLELLETTRGIDLEHKPLLIAETLARRRASMRPEGTAAAAAGGSELAVPGSLAGGSSPSVSALILSLTSRIGPGSNLLHAIRQMTSSLPAARTSTTDLVRTMSPAEREDLVFRMVIARRFLGVGAAADLVGRAIDAVRGPEQVPEMLDHRMASTVSSEMVAALDVLLTSALSSSRKLPAAKPDIDTPEYRERIRYENRERKKRWREENAERNRDNDLRLRVLKRAQLMFGDEDTPEKRAWADEEFDRRKVKRLAKQQKEEDHRRPGSMGGVAALNGANGAVASPSLDNPDLAKPLHDVFHILADLNTDPSSLVPAVSACTATIASVYAFRNGADLKTVEPAVLSTMAQLMDLTRGGWSQDQGTSYPRFDLDSAGYAYAGYADGNSKDQANNLTPGPQTSAGALPGQPGSEYPTSDQNHHNHPGPSPSVRSTTHAPRVPASLSAIQSGFLSQPPKRLQMPSYRLRTPPLLSGTSPFLSNKQTRPDAPKGLRKPASFQRPHGLGHGLNR